MFESLSGYMRYLTILGCALFFAASSYGADRGFDFAHDGERIVVRINLQDDLKLRQMKAIYRSTVCTFSDYTASGVEYKRDGYNNTVLQPSQEGESDIYTAIVAADGGGACQWKLSNLTFGVDYKYPELFGSDFQVSGAGGVSVAFDDNRPQHGASHELVEGDLDIIEDYYLWVSDRAGWQPRKFVGLFSNNDIYLSYKAKHAKSIYFEPRLYSDYVVHSSFPEVKVKGSRSVFTYPDGSVVSDGSDSPDYNKLQCIRLASGCKD
ncbi:hypothetical protein [Pseudomonas sp. zfem002]|uniref:hypothetical protein n=1 Tax=Pseudomonas sp. zfem002 TaxID=3078197 RepID=UPI00292997FA|nr:hypothetical protein [Pseudomonas sp. zfem002]MDU9393618.1 hypothetical protein [Pseudomonas sp. zfem002]